MGLKDWKKTVENEFYNSKTNSQINIIQQNAGYKVRILNKNTLSSSWKYKSTWKKKDALRYVKSFMRSN